MRVLISVLTFLLVSTGFASWGLDISTGTSYHLPNVLTVSQGDFSKTIPATWETRPWVGFKSITQNYYTVRVRYTDFELELVHDRAIFTGKDDNIQHYELTNGLNYVMANYAPVILSDDSWEVLGRIGIGVSVPNPTSTVSGLKNGHYEGKPTPYYFGGIAAQVGVQAKYWVNEWFGLSVDGKYTFAEARAPIAGGSSYSTFNGFHIGFGTSFRIP